MILAKVKWCEELCKLTASWLLAFLSGVGVVAVLGSAQVRNGTGSDVITEKEARVPGAMQGRAWGHLAVPKM